MLSPDRLREEAQLVRDKQQELFTDAELYKSEWRRQLEVEIRIRRLRHYMPEVKDYCLYD